MHKTKFIVVTGGVLSGLGKGTASASIGRLLKDSRKFITIKCDGYLNVDPGTMNPTEHGEVFVLHDGGEVDMDFGHYERYLGVKCKFEWNITSGKIFHKVIQNERKGKYLGKTIQIYPHIVNEIKEWIFELVNDEKPDITIIEIGGTVGDIENSWFIEATRQLKKEVGSENIIYIHLTYVPFLHSVGEPKTKTAQRDIALIRSKGIIPDVVICRSKEMLPEKIKEKISLFGDIDIKNIISGRDVDSIYEIPLMFKKEGLLDILQQKFGFETVENLEEWEKLVEKIKTPTNTVTIAICGKYTALKDSYASIIEALKHAGAHLDSGVILKWIETTDIEKGRLTVENAMQGVDGVLVPGGFGHRGTEGKISVVKFAREKKVPYLGICYGLQIAVIEFARHMCDLADANSTEINHETKNPVIDILPEQKEIFDKGGTMRLGACKALLKPNSILFNLYKKEEVWERHRHRYEVNPYYHRILEEKGMVLSGMSESRRLAEFIELKQEDHPYFVATQAHNELTSRLEKPNPLFYGFIKAALEEKTSLRKV